MLPSNAGERERLAPNQDHLRLQILLLLFLKGFEAENPQLAPVPPGPKVKGE